MGISYFHSGDGLELQRHRSGPSERWTRAIALALSTFYGAVLGRNRKQGAGIEFIQPRSRSQRFCWVFWVLVHANFDFIFNEAMRGSSVYFDGNDTLLVRQLVVGGNPLCKG